MGIVLGSKRLCVCVCVVCCVHVPVPVDVTQVWSLYALVSESFGASATTFETLRLRVKSKR
jgi:hypothetical protein